VLGLVGDGSSLSDYSNSVGIWATRVNRQDPRYRVVPASPAYAKVPFLAELQSHFPGVKILEWTRNPAEAVPAILNAADLTARDYRVFISYYQQDGRQHADDLQGALSLRGFDVFLDRASIGVGQNIPQRIREEIAHKSVLMVLETPLVTNSSWVPQEIAVAAANRLGILAIHFPNGNRIASLSNRRRESLNASDLDGNGRLTPGTLDVICRRVSNLHDFWLLRRRYQMQRALSHALLHQGITNHRLTPEGWLDVVPNWKRRTVCSIRTSPRLAELADFRELDDAIAPTGSWQRAVVAPGSLVPGHRQAEMGWLSALTCTSLFDESEIRRVANVVGDPNGSALR
jgi:hypothetical protein